MHLTESYLPKKAKAALVSASRKTQPLHLPVWADLQVKSWYRKLAPNLSGCKVTWLWDLCGNLVSLGSFSAGSSNCRALRTSNSPESQIFSKGSFATFFSSSAVKVKTAGAQKCCEFEKPSDTGSWSFFLQGAQTPYSSYVTGHGACHLLHGLGGCLRIQLLQRVSNIEFRIIQMFNQSHHTHIFALFVFKWERLTKSDTALMAYQERREASTYGELYSILAQHLDMDYVWRKKMSSVQNPRLVVLL